MYAIRSYYEGFIAFCPWAPSYPYEFWIVPKKHNTSFSKITQKEINDLSLILRATLGGLSNTIKNVSYNMVFHLVITSYSIHYTKLYEYL